MSRKSNLGNITDDVSGAQREAQIRSLKREDSSVTDVLLSCSHAALYVLENGASVHWRKLGIEGFFYILKRDSLPRYRLLLRNQADSGEGDFIQSLDEAIKYEVKQDTFFFQVGPHGEVRGLWFHDKDFMPKFIGVIDRICNELGLICDGAYENSSNQPKSTPDANTTSGKAILQMLKRNELTPSKESQSLEIPSVRAATPANGSIVDMLRLEFATPHPGINQASDPQLSSPHRSPPPPPPPLQQSRHQVFLPPQLDPLLAASPLPRIPHPGDQYVRPILPEGRIQASQVYSPVDSFGRPIAPPPVGPPSDLIMVSRNDLRLVLGDMIGSDQFINELFLRLAHRSHH